jgi:hypothetical protein
MNKIEVQRKLLKSVIGLVFLTIILLIIIISLAVKYIALPASIALFVMILFHLLIFYRFWTSIKVNKRGQPVEKGYYIILGILLLICGIVILDGAFASLDKNLVVSVLMFITVFCDVVAAIVTFGAMLIKTNR